MRVFAIVLFLIFSVQSWTKADDIRDFQIEGISVGDSALEYFSEVELNKNKQYYKNSKSKTFFLTNVYSSNFKKYDNIMFHFKDNDPEYIIHSIAGAIYFKDDGIKNIEDCMIQRKEIDTDLQKLFKNSERTIKDNNPHEGDPTGNTFEHAVYYWFADTSVAFISCNDYSKSFGGNNHLKVAVVSSDLSYWLNNIAYD